MEYWPYSESDSDVDDEMLGMTLHRAARVGDLEALRDNIARGDDVDGRDGAGSTPLMEACRFGRHECARALVDANAAVDEVDNDGKTALMRACRLGQHECAQALIDAGAAVDTVNNSGWTALMEACDFGSYECTRALIGAQADLELTNRDGKNALMIACASPSSFFTQSMRQFKIRCALALLAATAPIQETEFPDWAASLQFACVRLQLIEAVLASPHVIEDAPQLTRVKALKTDAQGIVVSFAGDMLASGTPRRRSRRLARKRQV